MCCIIVKPKGVEMPSKNILERVARVNGDGFGFCTNKGKSFKSIDKEEFFKSLENITTEEECILHFRWATHGSKTAKNCHPFYDEDTDTWFAHNGVMRIAVDEDITDSEFVFRKYIVPDIKNYGFDNWRTLRLIRSFCIGQRFAIMHNGKVHRFGNWTFRDGCYYSNINWVFR